MALGHAQLLATGLRVHAPAAQQGRQFAAPARRPAASARGCRRAAPRSSRRLRRSARRGVDQRPRPLLGAGRGGVEVEEHRAGRRMRARPPPPRPACWTRSPPRSPGRLASHNSCIEPQRRMPAPGGMRASRPPRTPARRTSGPRRRPPATPLGPSGRRRRSCPLRHSRRGRCARTVHAALSCLIAAGSSPARSRRSSAGSRWPASPPSCSACCAAPPH